VTSTDSTARGVALFFGPHPDDIELFAGGTAARLARLGHRVVLVDLTRGELASNGTPELRAREAAEAARALGAAERRNLALPDGALDASDRDQVSAVATCIREVRPDVVFAPAPAGRHPDHEATCELVRRAVFHAGLARAPIEGERHTPGHVLHYICRVDLTPTLLVPLDPEDIAAKARAIAAHASQVGRGPNATLVGSGTFPEILEARDRTWGAHAGTRAAEPFVSARVPVDDDPIASALAHPASSVHWLRELTR
jgi:bacillithiol biosynthesis deacetylase BshB1